MTEIKISEKLVKSLFHVFLIAPVILYIGVYRPTQDVYYYLLLLFGAAIIVRFIIQWINNKLYTFLYLHTLVIAPFLVYVSILHFILKQRGKNIPSFLYDLLVCLGLGAGVFHLWKLIR